MRLSRTGKTLRLLAIFATCGLPLLTGNAWADRIKDLASVQGVRNNQLVGYGLVVGLEGVRGGYRLARPPAAISCWLPISWCTP